MYASKANSATTSPYGEAEQLLDILDAFSTSIIRGGSIDDILWGIASQCISNLAFEDCVVYLLDENRQVLVQKAAYGPKNIDYRSIFEPIEIPIGKGVVGRVAASGLPLLIDDLAEFEDYIVDDLERRSELAVPILCDNRVIGVIDSEHSLPDFFQTIHVKTLVNIAHIAGHKIGRTKSKESSREMEQFYQLNPNPVLQISSEGRVIHSNPVARDCFGTSAHPGQIVRIKGIVSAIEKVESTKQTVKFEFEVGTSGEQNSQTFTMVLVPLENGNRFNVYGTDSTAVIKARQRAEKANSAKSAFLSVMSHEIRTPLNAILGLTDLLLHGNHDEAERKQNLQYMEFSGQHLLGLINNILDLEKIGLGKEKMVPSEFHLRTLLQQVIESFQNNADRGGLRLELCGSLTEKRENTPLMMGDVKWITQILNNLLSNAIKYTEQGGVCLSVERINMTADAESDVNWVRFRVKDTGRGIAEPDIKRILKAFEQVDEPSNQRIGGTGLGLAITANLIELHSGLLHVESEVGVGSSFTVDLPLKAVNSKDINPANPMGGSLKGAWQVERSVKSKPQAKSIIIADDNDINRFVAEGMLKRWGYSVLSASGGRQAIELWKKNRPCLILMDIHMPDMDGLAASRAIRSEEPDGAIRSPIIALTADADESTIERLKTAGMDGLVLKPFKPALLQAAIEQQLKGLTSS
jgi:signal transduction histidine kinase/CheY-like chemotaxis protein/putative methionine-R-sulfoxide reductase with GAF domain